MGLAQLRTVDASKFVFTRSTDLDPTVGGVEMVSNAQHGKENGNGTAEPAVNGVEGGARPKEEPTVAIAKDATIAPAQLLASMLVCCLCNNASVSKVEDGTWKPTGDPTEVALVVAAEKSGFGKIFWTNQVGLSKSGEFAFDSDRKLMSSIYKSGSTGTLPFQGFSSSLILAKGAPEGIMGRCVSYLPGALDENSLLKPTPLDDEIVQRISDQSAEMAGQGLRVLGMAIRLVDSKSASSILESGNSELSETELCFVGLVGLIDPPK
jgi:Ca2+-transporting ATPase